MCQLAAGLSLLSQLPVQTMDQLCAKQQSSLALVLVLVLVLQLLVSLLLACG